MTNDLVKFNIGYNVRRTRMKRGLTQAQLAKAMGVGIMTLSRWECGKSDIGASMLKRVAETLNISADFLLGLPNNQEQVDRLAKIERIVRGK